MTHENRTEGKVAVMENPKTREAHFLIGVFLMCMCGLMLQIMETRILSIITYYHMAFFAIGIAMLGMTAGALLVYYERLPAIGTLSTIIAWVMTCFAWSTLLSLVSLLSIAITPQFEPTLRFLSLWAITILVLLPPYVLLGIGVSLALTRSPYPVARVYGIDLVGAASGCLVTLGLLSYIDTYSAVIVVAGLGAASAWFFEQASHAAVATETRVTRWFAKPTLALAAIAMVALMNIRADRLGLRPLLLKGFIEPTWALTEERWNSFSRVTLALWPKSPAVLWSPSSITPAAEIEQGWLKIDGEAGTPIYRFDGDWKKLEFLRYDATALAYTIRNQGRAAVIGVGGGRDVLTASLSGFRDVTGVEYNPIFIDLFSDEYRRFSGADKIPGLKLVVDDARSWFARSQEKFDLVQMSLVDTWAATGAGAFTLSENGLYTVDGWKRFFARLTPNGVFTVSRWFTPKNLDETGRVLSLAMATLLEQGVSEPAHHLFLAGNRNLSTLIVGRSKLSDHDLSTLREACDRLHYKILVDPGREPEHAVLKQIMGARSIAELVKLGREQTLDLSPTWDRNPFFFNQIRLTNLGTMMRDPSIGTLVRGNLTATLTLFTLVAISMVFTFFVLLLPAARSMKDIRTPLMVWGSAYFLLIGLGFMFAEIGLIQRTSIFLGHPIYGLAIALFGIIASTGFGSFFSDRLMRPNRVSLMIWPLALAIYLFALPLWHPFLMQNFESGSLLERSTVCLLAIVPSGVLMGFMFPTGMRLAALIDARPTPWFWAVNGAAGVLGSGVAVLFSIQTSLDATLRMAALCYGLLALVAVMLGSLVPRLEGRSGISSKANIRPTHFKTLSKLPDSVPSTEK